MDIIKVRRDEREFKILQIMNSIAKAREMGLEIDEKKLISECCNEWNMSDRSVKEYVKMAKYKLQNLPIKNIDTDKEINEILNG